MRGFSAPVRLDAHLSDEQLAFLWSHDRDAFNRWEGGQELATRLLLTQIESDQPMDSIDSMEPERVELFHLRLYQNPLGREALSSPKSPGSDPAIPEKPSGPHEGG